MGRGYRQDRIGEEIKKIISDLLIKGLKDPRLEGMISITGVEVTSDYSYATVYFSSLDVITDDEKNAEKDEEIAQGFASSSGFIRNRIGRELKLKHTPELIFKADRSEEYGRHIDQLIDSLDIKSNDEEQ